MSAAQENSKLYSLDEVVEILHSILARKSAETEKCGKLHADLTSLAGYIRSARSELTKTREADASYSLIPATTDELDAVITETFRATATIMDACEIIERAALAADELPHAVLIKAATSIYEACSFQDITGQRITKVIRTLKEIEKKVAESLASFDQPSVAPVAHNNKPGGDALLNGPQIKGPATNQEEIDKLLNSFN